MAIDSVRLLLLDLMPFVSLTFNAILIRISYIAYCDRFIIGLSFLFYSVLLTSCVFLTTVF
jgi:hypothetical protein